MNVQNTEFNRRGFHKLSMAALGGLVAGSVTGCGGDAKVAPAPAAPAGTGTGGAPAAKTEVAQADNMLTGDVHVCHGLNACKGKGADGKNECAGQGTCATKSTHHSCSGQNACKGQGGCGETSARNSCKEQGGCHVPLMEEAWKGARKHFEETMKKQGKEPGKDPGKAKES